MTVERRSLEGLEEPFFAGDPEECMALVEALSRECWALSGRPLPSVPRSEWPIHVFRFGEDRGGD